LPVVRSYRAQAIQSIKPNALPLRDQCSNVS